MNKYFILELCFALLFSGCVCEAGFDSYQVEGFRMEKNKWNYKSSDLLKIPFNFITIHHRTPGKWYCIGYTKEKCVAVSDEILNDSTKIFCNKTLKNNTNTYSAMSNLLGYNALNQSIEIPSSIHSKSGGNYNLNLNSLSFNNTDLTTPYIFTLQV